MIGMQLLGREQVTLDAKHRLALPARYRDSVQALCADQLVATEHPDGFLLLMPEPKWQSFAAQFASAGQGSQWLKRIILGGASAVQLDSAKRFLLPAELREAHERNDEVLERIYIGRRFRNDTERLEKLFELYMKMTASPRATAKKKRAGAA